MNIKYNKNPAEAIYWYAYYGLVHKNRVCPYCTMPMRIVRSNKDIGFPLAW